MTFTLSTTDDVNAILCALMLFHVKPWQPVFVAVEDERGAEVDEYFDEWEREMERDT